MRDVGVRGGSEGCVKKQGYQSLLLSRNAFLECWEYSHKTRSRQNRTNSTKSKTNEH